MKRICTFGLLLVSAAFLLPCALSAATFTGGVDSAWETAGNWDTATVPTSSDDVTIPSGKKVVATTAVVCKNLSLAGELTLGSSSSRPNVSLAAEGDIALSGSAKLTVYAGRLADLTPYGTVAASKSAAVQLALYDNANVVSAKGTMTFGDTSTVYPNNDILTGTPVIFRAADITVAAGATVNADGAGWGWKQLASGETKPDNTVQQCDFYTYSLGYGSSYNVGAGYGGKGGGGSLTYGFALSPLMPGSPGGCYYNGEGSSKTGRAGGTICLQATNALSVLGRLTAVGNLCQICGSSGGGIWLCGASVDYSSAVLISANGADNNKHAAYGAGGGGRVAVSVGYTASDLRTLAGGTDPGSIVTSLSLANVTAAGGNNPKASAKSGSAGTVYLYENKSAFAMVGFVSPGVPTLNVEGIPTVAVARPFGEVSFDAPAYAFLASDPANVRYSYGGFVVSNATSEVKTGGASDRKITFTTCSGEGAYTVYLKWTNPENRRFQLSVPAAYGTFTVDGTNVGSDYTLWGSADAATPSKTIGFVPAAGCTFVGWSGSYPRSHALANPAVCSVGRFFGLTARVSGCSAAGEAVSWKGGTGDWADATKWSTGKVPTLLDDVTVASGTITVKESFAAKSLTIMGGELKVGTQDSANHAFGTVAGDLALSGTAKLTVQAARPVSFDKTTQTTFQSTLYSEADTIRIDGAFTVGSGTTVTISNDRLTGVPFVFRPGSFTVASGGTVKADECGFCWFVNGTGDLYSGVFTATWSSKTYATHGYGRGSGWQYSAGYGGKCYNATATAGASYGFEYAPLLPGSPCGLYNGYTPRGGGGTVCVFAGGAVSIGGTVQALGNRNSQNSSCSGGAIWLAGSSVAVADGASVSANGEANGDANYGGGGGGRIAFAVGLDEATLDRLADGADPADCGLTTADIVSDLVTVNGGVDSGNRNHDGKAGTKKQVLDPNSSTTFAVTANPSEYFADDVVYAKNPVNYGTSTTLTAPDWSYNTTARTDSRYAYAGYIVSNKNEAVATGGAGDHKATVSFVKPLGPYELRWIWGARETHHIVTVQDTSMGSVTLNGAAYEANSAYWSPAERTDELVATPAAGCAFVCWTGNVATDASLSPTLRLSAATAYKVTAVFRRLTAEPTTYHWKDGATGDWTDLTKWTEGNVPGAADDVVIGAGACTAVNLFEVNSLTLTNAASLTVSGCRDVIVAKDLRMRDSASLRIVARETDATHTWTNGATLVRIGGLFSLTNAATFYPACDAYSGGAPVVRCQRFELGAEAKVDAKSLGFGGTYVAQYSPVKNLCPGFGSGSDYQIGGGYGGRGGNMAQQGWAGWTYGLQLSPIHPGAPNGTYDGNVRRGGGLVRIHADRMRIDGTIDASGVGYDYGGPSGGGIWLTSFAPKSLSFGPSAQLLAKGGHSNYSSPNYPNSKGGGGRIAIGLCLSQETMAKMIETAAYPGKASKHVFGLDAFTNRFEGVTVDLRPGDNWSTETQYQGTFNFVDGTQPGLMLVVR